MIGRLTAMAALAPRLESGELSGGHWHPSEKLEDGSNTFPWFERGPALAEFAQAASPCVELGFNWPEWNRSEEARVLFTEPGAIEAASEQDLAHMVTTMLRQDRFVEGALASHFDEGIVQRVCRRAAVLVSQPS